MSNYHRKAHPPGLNTVPFFALLHMDTKSCLLFPYSFPFSLFISVFLIPYSNNMETWHLYIIHLYTFDDKKHYNIVSLFRTFTVVCLKLICLDWTDNTALLRATSYGHKKLSHFSLFISIFLIPYSNNMETWHLYIMHLYTWTIRSIIT